MDVKRNAVLLYSCLTLGVLVGSPGTASDQPETATSPVVMVCEHGAVKSVIAASLFDREAKARGLALRAISRGIEPYEQIPSKISEALENDGFDVSDFDPQELSRRDVASALRVIAIGSDLSSFQDDATSAILQWDDVPPASVDYDASKTSLLTHIRTLLDELQVASQ